MPSSIHHGPQRWLVNCHIPSWTVPTIQRLGLESKPKKDWRHAARRHPPQQAQKHLEKGRELVKEAKGLK
jgi:hypothetical protein